MWQKHHLPLSDFVALSDEDRLFMIASELVEQDNQKNGG